VGTTIYITYGYADYKKMRIFREGLIKINFKDDSIRPLS
jgi:hypothetical protein